MTTGMRGGAAGSKNEAIARSRTRFAQPEAADLIVAIDVAARHVEPASGVEARTRGSAPASSAR
jgi:hypothetical protein